MNHIIPSGHRWVATHKLAGEDRFVALCGVLPSWVRSRRANSRAKLQIWQLAHHSSMCSYEKCNCAHGESQGISSTQPPDTWHKFFFKYRYVKPTVISLELTLLSSPSSSQIALPEWAEVSRVLLKMSCLAKSSFRACGILCRRFARLSETH